MSNDTAVASSQTSSSSSSDLIDAERDATSQRGASGRGNVVASVERPSRLRHQRSLSF